MTLLYVFGAAQIFILLLVLGAIGLCYYKAYKASKSGSKIQDKQTGKWIYSDENIPFHKQDWFYMSFIPKIFLVVAIVEIISEL